MPAAKLPARRQAAVPTEGEKDRLSNAIPVRKTAARERHASIAIPAERILNSETECSGLKPAAG